MLEAQSAAVVGASVRDGSLGRQMLVELRRGGFSGRIFPVNPRYDEVEGLRCYPSMGALPSPVDVVLLGVANGRQEEQARQAAEAGARSLVIFASLYDDHEGSPSLKERVAGIARDAGMAVCGGNCMGFLNVERGVWATGFAMPALEPGGVTFISHSGSAFGAFAYNQRRMRFNLLASPGQELTTTAADYLRYALELESTRAVGLFLEEIRDPLGFREALDAAAARDVPVVALKVGRSSFSRRLVEIHSRADAGEDEVYQALFERYGVLRVRTLQEMADTLELLNARRWAAPGGLTAIHDSGGERALLVDLAEDHDVPLARLSSSTEARIQRALDPGLEADNPLDAWGTGLDQEDIFSECLMALVSDSDAAGLAFVVDLTTEETPDEGYVRIAKEVFARTEKPFAVVSNLASAIDPRDAESLRRAGIPVLEDVAGGLEAFRHLFEYRDVRGRQLLQASKAPDAAGRLRWRRRLYSGEPLNMSVIHELLGDYGLSAVDTAADTSADALGRGTRTWIGLVRHQRFGPIIAAGGATAGEDIVRDGVAMPPLDVHRSLRLLESLSEVDEGSPGKVAALISTLSAVAALAEDMGDFIEILRLTDLSWASENMRIGGVVLIRRQGPH